MSGEVRYDVNVQVEEMDGDHSSAKQVCGEDTLVEEMGGEHSSDKEMDGENSSVGERIGDNISVKFKRCSAKRIGG